ncbi:type I methionyl aminopeptidase [Thermodesulfatator autotrophicus]|uniref:Methionine aminopeptidase n=1 Tax=Thermodesulfatator autotrophicus TaxID=1795632 RepID=A0A177E6U9_9BACT|nr:type I methionyl aminopeptidase [Thermodesulfatator autotrophicus]OAG27221.1 methionine aminopeptidase [Thermodesulfatator autotrophicus]
MKVARGPAKIKLRAPWEIDLLRKANAIVAEVLLTLKEKVTPGITAWDLNQIAEEIALKRGARPAFKGYRGYPFSLCVSVNEEVVHGLPLKEKVLKEGDIVSFDFGTIYEGYYGDAALTVAVGEVSEEAKRLMEVTEKALYRAIEKARVGNRVGDISAAVQNYVEKKGYNVIRDFVGHGIGESLHEPPEVPNFGRKGKGPRLMAGMVIAIEPMVVMGSHEVEILPDGWTAVTKDRSLAAHYEHSVVITAKGPEILSKI